MAYPRPKWLREWAPALRSGFYSYRVSLFARENDILLKPGACHGAQTPFQLEKSTYMSPILVSSVCATMVPVAPEV